MRFILGVDASRFPGEKIERNLRPDCDIGEYDIIPYWQNETSLLSQPQKIEDRAHLLVERLFREAESASYYVGFTRGFYMHQVPRHGRMDLYSVCFDFAVAVDRLKERRAFLCLNPLHIKRRVGGEENILCDDTETLHSLRKLIGAFCTEDPPKKRWQSLDGP